MDPERCKHGLSPGSCLYCKGGKYSGYSGAGKGSFFVREMQNCGASRRDGWLFNSVQANNPDLVRKYRNSQ
jgi:hypothetical protein